MKSNKYDKFKKDSLDLNKSSNPSKEKESLSIILNELVKRCDDYKTLKIFQSSTSTINALFTCPSQSVWKQLCSRDKYYFLLKQESKSFATASKLVWESIYYQNWQVNFNWTNKNFEMRDISASFGSKRILMKMINTAIGISIAPGVELFEDFSEVTLWDLKRGNRMECFRVKGLVTCSAFQGNKLVLGKECGSIHISKVLCSNRFIGVPNKIHSKEVSAIQIEGDFVISADVGGQILSFPIESVKGVIPTVIYDNQSSGITSLLINETFIYATTQQGSLISINRAYNGFLAKKDFLHDSGSINCMIKFDKKLYLGTDSGALIWTEGKKFIEAASTPTKQSPIVSLATDSRNRIVAGHFDGTISIYSNSSSSEHSKMDGPIWSLGIDEVSLISSSINGKIVIYNYFS